MTGDLRPYPEYKDTGLPWLGRIPKHWDIERLKWLATNVTEQGPVDDRSAPYIALEHVESWTGRVRSAHADMAAGIVKHFRPDDILFNKLRPYLAKVTRPQVAGVCVGEFLVLRQRDPRFSPSYYEHLLRSQPIIDVVNGSTFGAKMPRADWADVGSLPMPIPPWDEQKAIAAYLDAISAKVRRFIRNRRRLIEVLNEQKQAIIDRAITRGLDPNAPLKPSSIDWLGDIPEHWEVVKLKRVARINPSRSEAFELRDSNDPVVFLPMERVSVDGQVDQSERRSVREVWQGFTYFRRGDVVVAKITPCFENGKGACLTGLDTEIGFGTTEFIVLRPSEAVSAEFLYQLTMLAEFRLLGVESMTGAAGQQRVSPDFVANFGVPVPPKHEQDRIVAYVEQKAAKFRALIDRARHEIDLIREYRTRLIADVVTGKVDVRGLALAEPPLDDEQIDEGIDDEEMLGDDEPELVEEAADADD